MAELTFTITTFTAGLCFVIVGAIFLKYPPKKINPFVGYRTRLSMRNQQTWDEGNRYSNKLMMRLGAALVLAGIVFYFIPLDPMAGTIAGVLTVVAAAVLLLYLTEKHLRSLFDEEGNSIQKGQL